MAFKMKLHFFSLTFNLFALLFLKTLVKMGKGVIYPPAIGHTFPRHHSHISSWGTVEVYWEALRKEIPLDSG